MIFPYNYKIALSPGELDEDGYVSVIHSTDADQLIYSMIKAL